MKGSHHITLETSRIKYEFEIKRNITIIRGDSATGKTTLVNILSAYSLYGKGSGVTLQSDVPCVVFHPAANIWQQELSAINDSIVFIDEDYSFIRSKEFADSIRKSSNYYVLITRFQLCELPYSINEIYGIRTSGKYHYPEKIYQEFYPIYENALQKHQSSPSNRILIVEDNKSGFQFFSNTIKGVKCLSSKGNSGILPLATKEIKNGQLSIIADGAAFGAFIQDLVIFSEHNKDISMYFPESFEWLILKSGVIDSKNIETILESPQDYIDSRKFFSWERFFTHLLELETSGDELREYKKDVLKPFYLSGKVREAILAQLPEGFVE